MLNLKAQLASGLRIENPVEIDACVDETQASAKLSELIKDIADASPLIKVSETRGGPHRTPSFSVIRPGEPGGPRFAGPGHEFSSLVLALLQAGGYPPKVDEAVLRRIFRELDGDFEF